MNRLTRTFIAMVVLSASFVGTATVAEAKPNPGPSSSYVNGTYSGTAVTTYSCDGTAPDPVGVAIEAQLQVNAKSLGNGTMHYGRQPVGDEDGEWFYTLNNGRGSLSGTAKLEFWNDAAIMTISVTLGSGKFAGLTSGVLSAVSPMTDDGPLEPCATPTIVAEWAGVISGVLSYG